jgi:DMSO/TMAO reductase YedYZ molybdopterin-dependent catalytic subunit
MAPRHTRWTLQVQSRREFLERSMMAAAWAGLGACSSADLASRQHGGVPQQDGGLLQQDGGVPTGPQAVTAYGPITPNEHFYITSCCGNPVVNAATWALSIQSRGVEITSVDYATLRNLPGRKKEHTLECISAGPEYFAISNAIWTGLPLSEVFDAIGVAVTAGTIELVFRSVEGYSASLPVTDLDKPAWLVWLMNGVELPPEHGYPARLLVPGRYGMKNPKWITSIDFVDQPFTGYWDEQGWSKAAPYQTNTLVHVPTGDVPAGAIVAHGTAFAGSDPILSVEVSVDGGQWLPATIDYSPGPDIWTLWHHDMVMEAGSHTLQARCSTQSGSRSNPTSDATDYLSGYDGSDLVTFNAT